MRRDEPLVAKLERQPGQKEVRFAHLLSGEIPAASANVSVENLVSKRQTENERIEKLEQQVESLQNETAELRRMFEDFKKQFE
jgi:uncharacterized protein YceH (UPF0502 family)